MKDVWTRKGHRRVFFSFKGRPLFECYFGIHCISTRQAETHEHIRTQISIIPGRFHQHKTQIKSSAQSKVFVLAQLNVTNLHLYTSKKALVKYYKFCFLGYITYLQHLGHSPFSPSTTSRLCLLSIFNNLGNEIQSFRHLCVHSGIPPMCVCIACWRLSYTVNINHWRRTGWSTWSRITTIVHVWLTQTHNYTKTTADDSSSTGICSFLGFFLVCFLFLVCFFEKPLWLPVPPPAPY